MIGKPFIRFYAGKSLYDKESNLPVGVFCIKDIKPRKMSMAEIDDFLKLAQEAEDEFNVNFGKKNNSIEKSGRIG